MSLCNLKSDQELATGGEKEGVPGTVHDSYKGLRPKQVCTEQRRHAGGAGGSHRATERSSGLTGCHRPHWGDTRAVLDRRLRLGI